MLDTQREIEAFIPEPSWNSVALAYGILAFQVRLMYLYNYMMKSKTNKRT